MFTIEDLQKKFNSRFRQHERVIEKVSESGQKGGRSRSGDSEEWIIDSSDETKDIMDKLRDVTY